MDRTFSLKIVCVICREVLERNGEIVTSQTKHRQTLLAATTACPLCQEPFIEACHRTDGSSVRVCRHNHRQEVGPLQVLQH